MVDSAKDDKGGMRDFWWFARGLLRPRHEAIIALIGASATLPLLLALALLVPDPTISLPSIPA